MIPIVILVTVTTAPTITGADSTPTAQLGGNDVYASENYRFETIRSIVGALELPNTILSANLKQLLLQVLVVLKHLLTLILLEMLSNLMRTLILIPQE